LTLGKGKVPGRLLNVFTKTARLEDQNQCWIPIVGTKVQFCVNLKEYRKREKEKRLERFL